MAAEEEGLVPLKVVCSGRGRPPHGEDSRTLGGLVWSGAGVTISWSEGSKQRPCIELRTRSVTVHGKPARMLDLGRIVFQCPVCGRNVPRKVDGLSVLFENGCPRVSELDIALLS